MESQEETAEPTLFWLVAWKLRDHGKGKGKRKRVIYSLRETNGIGYATKEEAEEARAIAKPTQQFEVTSARTKLDAVRKLEKRDRIKRRISGR